MNFDAIMGILVNYIPALASVASVTVAITKIIASNKESISFYKSKAEGIRNEMTAMNEELRDEYGKIANALSEVLVQNAQLKRELKAEREARTGVKED